MIVWLKVALKKHNKAEKNSKKLKQFPITAMFFVRP